MATKEEIIQELEAIPEYLWDDILILVRSFKELNKNQDSANEVWQAYSESKHEREEVYRNLAES